MTRSVPTVTPTHAASRAPIAPIGYRRATGLDVSRPGVLIFCPIGLAVLAIALVVRWAEMPQPL